MKSKVIELAEQEIKKLNDMDASPTRDKNLEAMVFNLGIIQDLPESAFNKIQKSELERIRILVFKLAKATGNFKTAR